jgi:hypothetical protein
MDGELNEASTELVRRHMGACEECTLKFASLEIQEDLLSRALVHDPGEEFFERFAADVARQIPGGKESGAKHGSQASSRAAASRIAPKPPAPAPAPRATPSDLSPPPAPEPEPARIEAPVPLEPDEEILAASTAAEEPLETRRPVPPEAKPPAPLEAKAPASARRVEPAVPRRKEPPRPKPVRHKVHRPAPAIPWYAALILAAISASAGVVASRTEPLSLWIDAVAPALSPRPSLEAPAPESPAPVPTEPSEPAPREAVKPPAPGLKASGSPVKGVESAPPVDDEAMDPELTSLDDSPSDVPDVPEPQPQEATRFLTQSSPRAREAASSRDAFASVPAPALAQVRAAQRSAASADADPSAVRYETAAADWERAAPLLQGWQQSQARFEIASARYRAWEMAPTAARESAAVAAIRSYMTSAAQGPARDQARAWMARLAR